MRVLQHTFFGLKILYMVIYIFNLVANQSIKDIGLPSTKIMSFFRQEDNSSMRITEFHLGNLSFKLLMNKAVANQHKCLDFSDVRKLTMIICM